MEEAYFADDGMLEIDLDCIPVQALQKNLVKSVALDIIHMFAKSVFYCAWVSIVI